MLIKVKGKKGNSVYYCNYNNNGSYNYTENSIFIAAVLNVLLSSFSEAKKMKWPTVSCRQESNTRHNLHF